MHELRPSWTSLTKGDILNYCYRRGSIKLSDVFLMAGWVYVQDLWCSALELRLARLVAALLHCRQQNPTQNMNLAM